MNADPSASIGEAAKLLIAARRDGRQIERLPESCRPLTQASGYAIQRRVAEGLGAIGGWKIGAANAEATPLFAPIFASDVYPSGVTLAAGDFSDSLIEAEIAFRLRRDLPLHARAHTYDAIAAAVELLPVFEIYRSRYGKPADATEAEQIADCLANRGLIFGSAAASQPVTNVGWTIDLNIAGAVKRVDDVRHPVGDPLTLVVWLANHLAIQGEGLRQGQIVTTGALILGPVGVQVCGQWRGLGSVSATFA